MNFSKIELQNLARAWIIISLAFAILFKGLSFNLDFAIAFAVSAFTVGLGFILHELGHKFLAQRYGCWAEFRANNFMLGLALIFSFFGFIFAAPGGVMIQGYVTKRKHAYIAMMGPIINLALGVVFGLLAYFVPVLKPVAFPGMTINFWLGLFNALPFPMFDGHKVYVWNKLVYACLLIAAIVLTFGSGQLFV
ncbi:MAG: metalloprotease [Candidatus Woesearchaeota archaeon]